MDAGPHTGFTTMISLSRPFLCATLLAVLSSVPARANFVFNGAFNAAGTPASDAVLGASNIPNWFAGPSGQISCFVTAANFANSASSSTNLCNNGWNIYLWQKPGGTAPTGNFMMGDGDPAYALAIQQNITGLTVNQTYYLSFYQAAGQQNQSGQPTNSLTDFWKVTLGNTTLNSPSMTVAHGGSSPWAKVTLSFVATSANETLSFLPFAQASSGSVVPPMLFLGNVSLDTPEPSSAWFVIIGLGLLVPGYRKARKDRT
jgi:hypothetical protein